MDKKNFETDKKLPEDLGNKKQQYYIKAFQKIDKGKLTWNWCSAFFFSSWLLYRKAYACYFVTSNLITFSAFCISVLLALPGILQLESLANIAELTDITPLTNIALFIGGSTMLISFVSKGILGNILYYSSIKYKIRRGYHLYKDYKGTNLALISINYVMIILEIISLMCLGMYTALQESHLIEIYACVLMLTFPIIRSTIIAIFIYKDYRKVNTITKSVNEFPNGINKENITKLI